MRKLVSMRAALGDDDLLGKALPGPSWASWRILLIAVVGEPLLDGERPMFAELTGGREREPCELVEEFHAVVGRRSGKTRAAATLATYLAALVDHSRPSGSGREGGFAVVVGDAMAGAALFSSDPGHLRWLACFGFADRERDGGHDQAVDIHRRRMQACEFSNDQGRDSDCDHRGRSWFLVQRRAGEKS